MPVYEFRCPDCNLTRQDLRDMGDVSLPPCPECQSPMRRKFSTFAVDAGMPEHFNHAAGRFVSNERALKDSFKAVSEERSIRTGIEHRFVPVDPRDKDECGVTDEGLEETYRRRHDAGQLPRKLWL